MKYLMLIPDGVAIRNFLFGSFADLLMESGEVVIWHALPQTTIAPLQHRWGEEVKWETLSAFEDKLIVRFLRQSKMFAQLVWQGRGRNDQLVRNRLNVRSFKERIFRNAAQTFGAACSGRQRLIWLEQLYFRIASYSATVENQRKLMAAERPNVVFCTHQRGLQALPGMLAARTLRIPTATFIYSWDNLPKGEMAVSSDYFLVWSEDMKRELLAYHPAVEDWRVFVVGTPQFEHYFSESLLSSRAQFFTEVGLSPNRQVICFSGSAIPTSPYDPIYLRDLAHALRGVPEPERPQIMFRRCPVDFSNRYDEVLKDCPEVVVSDPVWIRPPSGDWSQVMPTFDDTRLLANVVRHCDAVINLGSTMAMDFAVLGKPGIYIDYEPELAEQLPRTSMHDVYRLPHFRTVHKLEPVYWVRSRDQIKDVVMTALARPQEKAEARQRWLRELVMEPIVGSSERCREALEQVAQLGPVQSLV